MKHLLTLLFSTSLTAFSQDIDTMQPLRQFDVSKWGHVLTGVAVSADQYERNPDTLRAIILATMCRRCAAEAIRGYVVIEQGKRPVYLNRCKKALKGFQVGWGWELIDPNYKKL